jgi:hypothetical protein
MKKVFVNKRTGKVASEEDQRKGAMLGNDPARVDSPALSISVEDPDAEEEGFDKEELMEDEDMVACAIPKWEDPKHSD